MITAAYDEAIHWQRNVFFRASFTGKADTQFLQELARLFQSFLIALLWRDLL